MPQAIGGCPVYPPSTLRFSTGQVPRIRDADGLSRRPNGQLTDDLESQKEQERIKQFTLNHLEAEPGQQVMLPEVVKAICERHQIDQP